MIIVICIYLILSAMCTHHYLNLFDGLANTVQCVISGLLTPFLWVGNLFSHFLGWFGVGLEIKLGPKITMEDYQKYLSNLDKKEGDK